MKEDVVFLSLIPSATEVWPGGESSHTGARLRCFLLGNSLGLRKWKSVLFPITPGEGNLSCRVFFRLGLWIFQALLQALHLLFPSSHLSFDGSCRMVRRQKLKLGSRDYFHHWKNLTLTSIQMHFSTIQAHPRYRRIRFLPGCKV